MKATATPEQTRQKMNAWHLAGEAIEEQRHRELFGMAEAEALKRSVRVLSLPKPWRRPGVAGEGMVEQQRWFMLLRVP